VSFSCLRTFLSAFAFLCLSARLPSLVDDDCISRVRCCRRAIAATPCCCCCCCGCCCRRAYTCACPLAGSLSSHARSGRVVSRTHARAPTLAHRSNVGTCLREALYVSDCAFMVPRLISTCAMRSRCEITEMGTGAPLSADACDTTKTRWRLPSLKARTTSLNVSLGVT